MTKDKELLYLYNEIFVAGNEYAGPEMKNSLDFSDFNTKVIISAPHSTRSTLNNKLKVTDMYTGAITKFIGEKNKLSHLVRTKHITKEENIWDYVLEKKIAGKFFLDFHGTRMDNDFNLAVGTGYFGEDMYEDELNYIKALAGKMDIKLAVNHPNYEGKVGLTGHLQKAESNNKALQFEWRPDYRNIYENIDNVLNKTIPFMESIVEFLNYK
ncbi:MAG: hypothetical protein LBR70_02355 [Lactobacillaceae bacterium]|jgi:hypothetical protein|nr:hypothetical protein [Lactobacillaceae bacterium]